VDPVPDPLLLRKCGSAGNRTRDLCVCSQELWSLDHKGGPCDLQAYIIASVNVAANYSRRVQEKLIMYPKCKMG
jgi:hypothetical protein